jgi:hypothetical protein
LGTTPPLPQPLRTLRVESAKRRVKTLHRRVRRGRKKTNSPVNVTAMIGEVWCEPETIEVRVVAAGEMVRTVVCGEVPTGVMDDGVKRHTAPEGRPPAQAKVMVELKPPVGVAVRVTGLEALPWFAFVEVVEGERVKAPTESRIVRVVGAEVLA